MRTPARSDRARPRRGRTLAIAVLAVASVPVLLGSAAGAQTNTKPTADVAALRADADKVADQYFQTLIRSRDLEDEIARNAQLVDELEVKAKRARDDARARALVAYKGSSTHLGALIDGQNVLDAARRAHLINSVNARDASVYAKLRATTEELRARRRVLDVTKEQQGAVLEQLDAQARAMNAKLAAAEQEARAEAAAAAAPHAAEQAAPVAATTPATVKPTATTAPPPKPTVPTAPPNYSGTPGTHPQHADPFLTCVRQREAGGNYGAVNPNGLYRGAYQFHQSTWNGSANHAGRSDLVGVPPNLATPYDQDEVAWALYQWQGAGPWGGACP